jgi:polyphosphate glucokinase
MARKFKRLLGVDVGATGIKGAIVDISTGEFVTERVKISTPRPASPAAFARVIGEIGKALDWKPGSLVGCGFPSVVQHGVTHSAANISDDWIGFRAEKYLSKKTKYEIALVNDADAAGMAEIKFGNVADRGTVLLLTLGTGIGSALFYEGQLIPNTELGHMPYIRSVAEDYVSNRARKERKLSMRRWAEELNVYLKHINRIMTPDLIILGGGISKKFDQYEQYIDPGVKVVPAKMRNNAGITGAALYAVSQ